MGKKEGIKMTERKERKAGKKGLKLVAGTQNKDNNDRERTK